MDFSWTVTSSQFIGIFSLQIDMLKRAHELDLVSICEASIGVHEVLNVHGNNLPWGLVIC